MKGFVKNISFLCILLLVLSLFGCSSIKEKSMKEPSNHTEHSASSKPKQNKTVTDPSTGSSSLEKEKNTVQTSTSVKNSTTSQAVSAASGLTAKTATNATTKSTVKVTAEKPVNKSTNNGSTSKSQQPALTVTLSITGQKDPTSIVAPTKVAYKEGDTVYTVLSREADKKNIFVDSTGSGATLYIKGLEDKNGNWSYYEFDNGPKSGWIFKVNGAEMTRSAGITSVKAGDRIECIYVQ